MTVLPTTHAATAWTLIVESAIRALTPAGGGAVRYRDVVTHIETLPGFPGWDHWGMRSHKGKQQPRALRSITLAAGKLKDAGTINQPRRGYYSLAVDVPGKTEAPMPEPAPVAPAAAPVAAPVAPAAAVAAPVVIAPKAEWTNDGVVYIPPTVTVENGFSSPFAGKADRLNRQRIANTRCFGAWSKRSAECKGCSLAALCQQAGMADFAAAAAAAQAADEAQAAQAAQALALALAAQAAQDHEAAQAAQAHEAAAVSLGSRVCTPFELECSVCKGIAPKGSDVIHLRGIGPAHPECAARAQQ